MAALGSLAWTGRDILGVTGRHVRDNEESAAWPQGSPIQTSCQINLPERTALSTSLFCSKLFSSCPSSTESRPKHSHGPAFQVLPRPAPGYLTDSSPASPFPTLCSSSQMDCCAANKLSRQPRTPQPLFIPFHLPGNVLPPQSPPPFHLLVSACPHLKPIQPHLPDAFLTDAQLK